MISNGGLTRPFVVFFLRHLATPITSLNINEFIGGAPHGTSGRI